jgi:Uma2 family endonuclease
MGASRRRRSRPAGWSRIWRLSETSALCWLSPSSVAEDRGLKASQYRTIESLQEYALVSQTEARVEVYRRQPGGHWLLSEFAGLEAAARFESVEASVPLAEIYSKIRFGPEEA